MAKTYKVFEVFTPTTPATVTFVERESLNDQLVDAIRTPGKQIVVYGHSGSGKTTLLRNKFRQLIEQEEIISRCTADTTLEVLIRDAFDRLGSFYTHERSASRKDSESAGLRAEYLAIKAAWNAQSERTHTSKTQRVVPIQLTPQRLVDFFGIAQRIWVVEDFHKLSPSEKQRFAQIMKVFMDGADKYPQVKIIAIGAAGTARDVVEYDWEMRNRVAEIYVPLLNENELQSVMSKGEAALNCRFRLLVKKDIVQFSSGLASVCHQLCLNSCFAADIAKTQDSTLTFTDRHVERALQRYLDDSSDTFKSSFDRGTRQKRKGKYDNCQLIVQALAALDARGASHNELLSQIRTDVAEYPAGNLTSYLKELQTPDRGELVRFDSAANTFSFANPLYRSYALVLDRRKDLQDIDLRGQLLADHFLNLDTGPKH